MPPRHTHVPPVQNNQPGTGFGSRGKSVGLGPSVTPLGLLSAPRMSARGAIWAHIQINKTHIYHVSKHSSSRYGSLIDRGACHDQTYQ